MTEARMIWQDLKLTVEGHAGGGTAGNDIVCAGISMMVNALAGVLEDAQMRGRTTFSFVEQDGKAEIQADSEMGCRAEIKAYFRMAVKGLKMIQEEYPKNIKVREV